MVQKSGKEGYRSFTVVGVGKHGSCKTKGLGGRFVNRKPAEAARKAFNELCRLKNVKGQCTLIVTIRETTQGSANKEFTYKLKREKLNKPVVRLEGTNNEYVIKYQTVVKAVDVSAFPCKKEGQSPGPMRKRVKSVKASNNRNNNKKSVKRNNRK